MTKILAPLLTEKDPLTLNEGTLDPLGLYSIANSLGVRLVPGVRERQVHPRFLTATAVSLNVCSEFDENMIAVDGVSPAWQVFEWFMVEGLVRTISDSQLLKGLPGRFKADEAIRNGVHLSANRYLKTPSVFGFHGVYRTLARELKIEEINHLGESGEELLRIWEEEQEIKGFSGDNDGPGKDIRIQLIQAVEKGLNSGASNKGNNWEGWDFFEKHLLHSEIPARERKYIIRLLLSSEGGSRHSIMEFLVSSEGRELWENSESERQYHQKLSAKYASDTYVLLEAIMTYERFARYLQDALDDCLYVMSRKGVKTSLDELSAIRSIQNTINEVPELFEKLMDMLSQFEQSVEFKERFERLAERASVKDWIELLLEHHKKVQRQKPPNGKRPWFERYDDGSCIIRTGYHRSEGGRHDREYVHFYRTRPLWSFARDLKMVE
jgi:hypothetical protein